MPSGSSTRPRTWPRAPGTAYHALQHDAAVAGRAQEYFDTYAVSTDEVRRGVAEGVLVEDTRVRDALRALAEGRGTGLSFPRPTTVETASYATEAAVLAEADVVRTQRWLDDLEGRVAALERSAPFRLERLVRRAVRRPT